MDIVASFAFYCFLRLFQLLGMQSVIDLFGREAGYCVYSAWKNEIGTGWVHSCHGLVWHGYILMLLLGFGMFLVFRRVRKTIRRGR